LTRATSQASTSGTNIDFTGIPATAKRITILFRGVSTNGSDNLIIQIGDSGGIETSGYISTADGGTGASSTAGFIITVNHDATDLVSGSITLSNIEGNVWVSSGIIKNDTGNARMSAGDKQLSATLDRVRITTTGGTNAFDAGTINILYE
jgi:hypothetical protein